MATIGASTGGDFERALNMYTFAEYDDPDLLGEWGDITISIFDSNEEAIQKLVAGRRTRRATTSSCPPASTSRSSSRAGLLQPLDKARIPNFANLDAPYVNQPWDPGNQYSVCKDWGTTGWICDTPRRDDGDRHVVGLHHRRADRGERPDERPRRARRTSPASTSGPTGSTGRRRTRRTSMRARSSSSTSSPATSRTSTRIPGIDLTTGNYALSQVWNGDARQGLLGLIAAGDDPEQYRWGIGAPETELWMDNWCIVDGARERRRGATTSSTSSSTRRTASGTCAFHGYHTGPRRDRGARRRHRVPRHGVLHATSRSRR